MPTPFLSDWHRAIGLELATLSWNVVGCVVLVLSAVAASSVALIAFGFDSLLEIGASTVVLWELQDRSAARRATAIRLIGGAFAVLTVYLLAHSLMALADGHRADASPIGLAWTAATAVVMFALATGKRRVGQRLGNPVVIAEARVTVADGALATAVVTGLILDAAAGVWWADPAVGLVVAAYAAREAHDLLTAEH